MLTVELRMKTPIVTRTTAINAQNAHRVDLLAQNSLKPLLSLSFFLSVEVSGFFMKSTSFLFLYMTYLFDFLPFLGFFLVSFSEIDESESRTSVSTVSDSTTSSTLSFCVSASSVSAIRLSKT